MNEILSKRTLHSKTHDLGNGQHRLVASMIPMHYEDNGQLLDIDMTIQNGVVNSGIYKVELLANKIGFKAIDRASGKAITVSLSKLGGQNVSYSAPTIEGNKATWSSVRTGTDVEFIFNPHQVNIFRVLQNASADKSAHWDVEEELGEKTIKMNNKVVGRDAARNQTKHTVVIAPPEETPNRKKYVIFDTFEDKVLKRNPQTRVKEEIEPVYPVRIDPTVDITIADTANDGMAEKFGLVAGSITTGSSFSISGTRDRVSHAATTLYFGKATSFFRFPGITIPQGSTINSAILDPYIDNSPQANVQFQIQAREVNNPSAPTNAPGVFSPATLASNIVTDTFGTADTDTRASINVQSIVQELVTSFDYSNEAMLFFIKAKTSTAENNRALDLEDFSHSNENPAQLVIDYTAGGGGSAIKTHNGLVDASVKTVNGVTRADVKNRNGLV